MSERSPPPPFSPLYPPPHHVPFTCNSCWWICCSWKRRLAHQTPLPARSKSVSLPRSKPVCDRPGGDSCEAANKRRRRGKKKPLLGIIAGNSFNSRRWKTPLNTGGNFANYCSMHLSNLILRLPPCIFLSLRCFFPLILHSWVVKWHMLTCYTPSLLKKTKNNGVHIWSNNGFPAIYAISEMFQQHGTQMALFFLSLRGWLLGWYLRSPTSEYSLLFTN